MVSSRDMRMWGICEVWDVCATAPEDRALFVQVLNIDEPFLTPATATVFSGDG